jgi:hypothetical protein
MNFSSLIIRLFPLMLIFISGCQKDKPAKRDYPQLRTIAVDHITPDGARFNAVITSGSLEGITEYGFVWGTSDQLFVRSSEKVVVEETLNEDNFFFDITFALAAMKEYYVRAYVKSNELILYGDPVKFTSLGSQAPLITDFEPKSATWGDTITIYGKNFSFQRFNNTVFFGVVNCLPVESTNNYLKVRVPDLKAIQSQIAMEIMGNRALAPGTFELIAAAKINTISKTDITWGDTIVVKGVFPFSTHTVKLLIDNAIPVLLESTESEIKAIVPNSIAYKDSIVVSLSLDDHILEAPQQLHMNTPLIYNIDPAFFGWGDTITIHGLFNPEKLNNKVTFGSSEAVILEARCDRVTLIVPYTSSHDISLTVGVSTFIVVYPGGVSLSGPIITDVTPHIAVSYQPIEINGRYFKEGSTTVKINNVSAYVVGVNLSVINSQIPDFNTNGPAPVEVTVYNKKCTVNNKLTIANPIIHDFTPKTGTYSDIITVNGDDFDPNDLEVRIGGTTPEILESTETKIRFVVPEDLSSSDNSIVIITRDRQIWSQAAFQLRKPEITSFTPLTGNPGEHMIISGNYFNPNIQYEHVYFQSANSTKEAKIISGNRNMIEIEIPALLSDSYYLKVQITSLIAVAAELFSCQSPWKKTDTQISQQQNYGTSLLIHYPNQDNSANIDELFIFGGFNEHGEQQSYFRYFQSFRISDYVATNYSNFPLDYGEVGGFAFSLDGIAYYGISNAQKNLENIVFTYNPRMKIWNNLNNDFPGAGRTHAVSFAINGTQGYVLGGENADGKLVDFWAYDGPTNQWSRLADFPGGPTSGAAALVIDQKAFIIDGNKLWIFDQSTNSWESKSDFPGTPRLAATGFAINGKIYYGTGTNNLDYYNGSMCFTDFWQYDPSTDIWKGMLEFPGYGRGSAFGYALNAKGYIGGGCERNYNGYVDIFEYDPDME